MCNRSLYTIKLIEITGCHDDRKTQSSSSPGIVDGATYYILLRAVLLAGT